MMSPTELALRTGTVAVLLLTGVVMLRDRRRLESGPYSGLMALSVAADTVMSITGYDGPPWLRPLQLIAAGTSAMMWIWIGTLFIDGFRPSWRAALAWALLPAIELVGFFVWFPWMGRAQEALSLLFVLLAGWRAVAGLRGDLVERRRRLRPVLATMAVLYSVGIIVGHALVRDVGGGGGPPVTPDRTLEAAGLAALSVLFAVLALRAGQPIFATPPQPAPAAEPLADADDPEAPVLARLLSLMEKEKIYRREGFDLGQLVTALDLPEYRLRRLINRRLGHRNFSSFVNSYRLAEVRAALADPGQAEVPVLTIALDAGFQSIGPFNRAFKAETGLTPTEYRRQAESRNGAPTISGIG
jgi:AraC-like DNA-binding protein